MFAICAGILAVAHNIHIYPRGTTYDDFSGQSFRFFEIIIYFIDICDLVHAVEAMIGVC